MGTCTQQALAQMLRATSGMQLQLDEFMLEHCCRIAEVTCITSDEEVQELTDSINQLLSQGSFGQLEPSIALTTQQIKAWLQQQSQGSSTTTACKQAPVGGTGRTSSAATSTAAAGTKKPGNVIPVDSKLKVSASEFVPGRIGATPSGSTAPGNMGAAPSSTVAGKMRPGGKHSMPQDHAARAPPPGFTAAPACSAGNQGGYTMQLPAGTEDARHANGTTGAHEAAASTAEEAWQQEAGEQHSYYSALQGDYASADWHGEHADWNREHTQYDEYQYDGWQPWAKDMQQHMGYHEEAYGADRQQQGQDTADALQLLEAMFPMYSTDDLCQLLQWYHSDLQACVHELMRLEEVNMPAEDANSIQQEALVPIDDDKAFPSLTAATAVESQHNRIYSPTGAVNEPQHKSSGQAAVRQGHNKGGSRRVENLWGTQPTGLTAGSWASLASKLGTPGKANTSATGNGVSTSPGVAKSIGRSTSSSKFLTATSSSSAARQSVAVPRVATGAILSAQYAAARAEAREWAIARNKCFEQATRAFRAGQKALAKELSAQGRSYAERMWEAHEKAAADLLQTRRAVRQGITGGPTVIDLHGLHVQEAVSLVTQHVKDVSAASTGNHRLQLVVGVGKHNTATRGRPRLLVALQVELEHMGLRVTELEAGLLEATW